MIKVDKIIKNMRKKLVKIDEKIKKLKRRKK